EFKGGTVRTVPPFLRASASIHLGRSAVLLFLGGDARHDSAGLDRRLRSAVERRDDGAADTDHQRRTIMIALFLGVAVAAVRSILQRELVIGVEHVADGLASVRADIV